MWRMSSSENLLLIMLIFLAAATGCSTKSAKTGAQVLDDLHSLDSITIAITDSGLGGLSVVADAANKLQKNGNFKQVNLVFFNALFSEDRGYNSLSNREKKVSIFNRALQELQNREDPDVILIACNTLSVLYQDTDFSSSTKTPAFGIVEGGVDLIADQMLTNNQAKAVIFATETTIDEETHKKALVELGIPGPSIITQKCPQLAAYIEQGFDSMETSFLIEAYVDEALGVLGEFTGPLFVSFNCTHYGYSLKAWNSAFESRGIDVAGFLNPNRTMIDFLLAETPLSNPASVSVDVRAISMVKISDDRIDSIGRYLHTISPETEAALRNYDLVPHLFSWSDIENQAE